MPERGLFHSLLLTALLVLVTSVGFACTNLIVGKLASVDGSVMCTYNCDGFGFASPLSWSASGRHAGLYPRICRCR